MNMDYPLISVLVPFYNENNTLARCLFSIFNQSYPNIELVIVNDGSTSKTQNYKSLLRQLKKEPKRQNRKSVIKKIIYHKNKENLGTLEARRTCVKLANGKYCCFVDCDDYLEQNALMLLYRKADRTSADIVHAKINVFSKNESSSLEAQEAVKKMQERCNHVYDGFLENVRIDNNTIINDFLCDQGHTFFLCAKLFRKDVLYMAFECIPNNYCCFAEDLLIYYFICRSAKLYCSINNTIYNYDITNGITSKSKITSLQKWKQVCSASIVFKIFYSFFDLVITEKEEILAIKKLCLFYLKNNMLQLEQTVDESILDQAKTVLNNSWGENFVKKMEEVE